MKIVGWAMIIFAPEFMFLWKELLWYGAAGFLASGGTSVSFGYSWGGVPGATGAWGGLPRGPPAATGTPVFNPNASTILALGSRGAVDQQAHRSFSDLLSDLLVRSVRAMREDDASARTNREGKTGSGKAVDTDSFENATWVAVAIDVAVGSIPGVGTVVGIYDAYGVLTDADSSTTDRVFAVVGVLPGGKIVNVLARTHIVQSGIQQVQKRAGAGIVYKRTNPKTGETYIGQSKSPDRFEARKGEHDTGLGVSHDYEILGRAPPGAQLDVLEEDLIRTHGGLQRQGGRLQNRRHQMSEERYRRRGGQVDDPNG